MNLYQKRRLVDYHIESRFSRLTTPDGYDFAFVPEGMEPQSACWRYDKARHRHNIVINAAIEKLMDRSKLYRHQLLFAERVYDHEGGHSLFTDRDNEKLNEMMKKAKIPFHLCNLFEDARIEARWRAKFGRRFNWMKYVLLIDEEPEIPTLFSPKGKPDEPKSAIRLFLDCIRMENSPKRLNDWALKDKDPKVAYEGKGKARYGRRNLIKWYYRRAIRARDTTNLFPIIVSWIKTFPETAASGADGIELILMDMDCSGEGGMPVGAQDADGSKHKEIKETIKISGSAAGTEDSKEAPKPAKEEDEKRRHEGEMKPPVIPHSVFFSSRRERTMDFRRGERLIRLFEKFLEGGEGLVTTRNPSGKIDMRRFLRGAEDIYIRKGDDPYGVKRISFIMDCSGSMSRAVEDGVYLAYVLNELVRRRKIECSKMIVCGGSNQAIPMPFDSRILDYLQAPGSIEGFAHAMRQHESDLLASDLTIFFTDGNITDEHINKSDWHRKGVYSIGLFVGNPERSSTLHQWFDSVLVRDNIESVADSLIQLIKRQ